MHINALEMVAVSKLLQRFRSCCFDPPGQYHSSPAHQKARGHSFSTAMYSDVANLAVCTSKQHSVESSICCREIEHSSGSTQQIKDSVTISSNVSCPENTVKCPRSYCIPLRFVCDGRIQCPGGEDEHDCYCTDASREVILLIEDTSDESESKTAAVSLAKQFFTSRSVVRILFYKSQPRLKDFTLTHRVLEIQEERVSQFKEIKCRYKSTARDLLRKLQFSKKHSNGIVFIESSMESSKVAQLLLSNLSKPAFSVYRIIKDYSRSLNKPNFYKFVKDVHISRWDSLLSTGYRLFPEICTEASQVPCFGRYRCSSSKQCIQLKEVCDGVVHCSNGDDERLCGFVCPQKCKCIGQTINCQGNDFNMTDVNTMSKHTRSADLSRNSGIKDIIYRDNLSFPFMLRLNISSCEIQKVNSMAFFHINNLLTLDIGNNKIKVLPENVFGNLHHLVFLNLDGNFELTVVSSSAFRGLRNIRSLRLSGTKLKIISSLTFSGLNLQTIDISNNRIEEIENYAFNNTSVQKINFEGNDVLKFGKFIFNDVTSLQELRTPAFKFCCIRPCYIGEDKCFPSKNEFSSCEDLMRNSVLQAVLWLVGIASLFGNLGSITYRLVYDRERLKIGYGIFVTNLAAADFLMGVYLIIIAVVDSLYRNRYIFMDDQWRKSVWCTIAGVMSTVSSEASVLFLCLITLDRLLVIKYPFGTIRFGPLKAYICCGLSWITAIALAVIPTIYTSYFQSRFYSKTGVCIALPLTRDKPPGWIYSVSIFVGLNFCTFIIVAFGQVSIFTELRKATYGIKKTQKSRRRDLQVARNLILVATTDFLCWFPIGVMEIGSAILQYKNLSSSVRMKREAVSFGKTRSIKEVLNGDGKLPVATVTVVSWKLADFMRLLHESYVGIEQISETNTYIGVDKKKFIRVIHNLNVSHHSSKTTVR
ncbi:G-protein coupled receptor GRL101-like [Mercenaria mercenaria]|uniref:G-protein coupled receptor GRL101-like n=1 Tax=Mercenaria mercenaria TaxID=6596 RepID=UPI00234F1E09|nr:G-protein coupled receptor GRL101-like [Mercenaria mercenaria]